MSVLPGLVRADVGSQSSLGALLDDAFIMHKSSVALIEASRHREASRWTYLDVRRASLRVARALEDAGIGADDRVAICMSNQPYWLVVAAACFVRGAVVVPLDYKLTAPEQQALVRHSGARLLVSEFGLFRRASEPWGVDVWVSEAPEGAHGALRLEDLPEGQPPTRVARDRTDLATIVYSSGTGGTPKGCMLTHGAYLAQLDALLSVFPMTPGDRYFSILPTNHAIDFMCGFVGAFVCGATVVHQRTLRPEMLRATLRRYSITHMAVVPLVLEAFARTLDETLDELPDWQRIALDAVIRANAAATVRSPNHGLSKRLLKPIHDAFGGELRLMFCGGAPTDRRLAERFYELGIPVVVGYGLTEACTVATVNRLTPFRADSVGRAVEGVEVRILDPDTHGVGQVLVRGPTLMEGYLDEPELTGETLIDGWLHTGDLGWLDASDHLHLVGRAKNMIVTPGGKNVYPEDIEGMLSGIPAQSLVVYASSYLFPGEGLEYGELIAVVRPEEDAPTWRAALVQKNRRLPDFKRLGGVLVWDSEWPMTASMKVKRGVLAEHIRAAHSRGDVQPLEAS